VLVGFVGLSILKTTENRMAEMMVLIITGYSAFLLSEHIYVLLNMLGGNSHLHLSGILACIFATITVNHVMTQAITKEDIQIRDDAQTIQLESQNKNNSSSLIEKVLGRIKATIEERDRHLRSKEDVQLLALVGNTILFVAMAEMIDVKLLWHYKIEIIAMFLATTLIRAIMMGLFSWITNKTDKMVDVSFRWWAVLTFAGIKGGLSIVMLSLIPASFEYLEMFKAVVIGIIMLSTFLYSVILLLIVHFNKENFLVEKFAEKKH
jgi:CPA1 family monovalent cation:H+ antiporter